MEKYKGVEYIEAAVKEYLRIVPSSMGKEKLEVTPVYKKEKKNEETLFNLTGTGISS